MSVAIREHRPGAIPRAFFELPFEVYRGDRAWVPPLFKEVRDRLTPGVNPWFDHGEAVVLTAWEGSRCIGRCTAQVDREHLRTHDDGAGFFGFLDTVDRADVVDALLRAAAAWLARRGMRRMRGPFSLCINEECGMLVEGFDTPPVLMMPHHRPYQGALVERVGLTRCKDLFAWKYVVGDIPPRAQRAWEQVRAMPEVRLRSVRKARLREELRTVMDIFVDAWADNWGFVPPTEAEVQKMGAQLGLLIDEDLAFFAEVHGRPVAMCIALPNLNEAIADLAGRLFPFGLFKLLWRLKVRTPRSARLMLLGIRKELRGVKRYGGLSTALYVEIARRGAAKGYEWGELSWTLEDNHPVNLGIRA
ncbi:MAG: hypothetical protein NZ898_03185, partial [Myxococcota bacterium]|nr:hypothetical protein [Myxococcota bacterium]